MGPNEALTLTAGQTLNFNKVCEIEDFRHDELVPLIRDLCRHKLAYFDDAFPVGHEYNKDWEVAMAVRALEQLGALRPDATILGVAAGKEDTLFYLTSRARQVFATDRYLAPGAWGPLAPSVMMVAPERAAPYHFDPRRLVVQHMDARLLNFPNDTFDGIFSSGSIEHFGELEDIAAAAYEMGRVLKPGGVLSISTVIKVEGPEGYGWPGLTVLMDAEQIERYIVEASGLDMVDELDLTISDATLATCQNLVRCQEEREARILSGGPKARFFDFAQWEFPHLVLAHEGYVFDSIHLALKKPEGRGTPENLWARPSRAVERSIDDYNRSLLVSQGQLSVQSAMAEAGYLADRLARLIQRRAGQPLESRGAVPPRPSGATSCQVRLAQGPEFEVIVDETSKDPLTSAYLAGQGHRINEHLVEVMLELVKPGNRVLDLGAFVGTFSLAAAAAGCEVCAVEASVGNAALLRLSAVSNGFAGMRVIQGAVTDRPQTLNFESRGPWGRVMEAEDEVWDAVLGIRVDDLLTQLGWDSVNFMKMDVEGWEMKAIQGMAKLLESQAAPPMILESNGHTLAFYDATPQQLCRQLEELGYRCYLVEPGRFVEVSPDEIQPQTVVDWLAVKGPLPDIPGYSLQPGLNTEEMIHVLVTEGSLVIDHHRAHVARTLADAPQEILGHERILKLLRSLQKDPSELVRSAVAWFDESNGGAKL